MIKAALIDMDGFLINSEHLYLEANKIYFKQFNFEFTEELHRQGTGKKFNKWITTVFPTDKSGEEILKERNVVFMELVREKLELLNGARELLMLLRKNFKTALVTSTERGYVDVVFEKTKIGKYFELLITGDMVSHGKPDPECYLIAAQKLGVSVEECVVFEDAPSGILSGKNAGMKVIAVPSPYVKGDEAFQKADVVVDTLQEITLEKIIS
ncbi:MAG: HAD family phosphatase [Candidatus Liptonbacteria bacterium]|nr:HAD family phosphatase [Candidatus Liptonbacteria bacterium]